MAQVVGGERDLDRGADLLERERQRDLERLRGVGQPAQMLIEPEHRAVVDPQALPDRVAGLEAGVEDRDRRLAYVDQPAVDERQQRLRGPGRARSCQHP